MNMRAQPESFSISVRAYHRTKRGHVWLRLFVGGRNANPLASCGTLVMRAADFNEFCRMSPAIEFIEEGQEKKNDVREHLLRKG